MNSILLEHAQLEPLLSQQQGVLLHSDLEAFWGNRPASVLHGRIQQWMSAGYLRRVCRGVYVGKTFQPWALVCRMYPDAAISTVSVLAKNALVGTAPTEQVWCVRIGPSRDYTSGSIAVHAWSIDPTLMSFGIEQQGALRVATPEKAFLDTLYFHLHGRTFPFSATTDIDTSRLDRSRIEDYLPHYKNLRFRAFARGVLDGRP